MAPEALVIAAFGLLGAILSIAGLRLSGQLRQLRSRLLVEVDAREKQGQRLAELDALRGRAVEARDLADGLRREISSAKSEITALKEQIEQQKVDLLRANATASDAMKRRSEIEAKIAELTAAAEAAGREQSLARERASQLEKQLMDAQKKLTSLQADGAKLTRSTSKAEADARAAAEAAAYEARALRGEVEEQQKALDAAWGEARAATAELEQVKAELEAEIQKRTEAEQRAGGTVASVGSPSGPAKGGGSGVIAALEADPGLNRGQRETIRMMYDKFTAKSSKG